MLIIKTKTKGFSLLELSVVLLILGILIYMTLGVTTAQLEKVKIQATQDKLTKIQNALIIFYQINNRLPCPADGQVAITDANFGKQATPSNITVDSTYSNATCKTDTSASPYVLADPLSLVYIGVVPTRDLGLPDETMMDGWGDRITYVVSRNCIDPDNWSAVNTYKCKDATLNSTTINGAAITINSVTSAGVTQSWPIPSTYAAFIIISHGKDRYGSYSRSGAKMQASVNVPNYQYEMQNGNLSGVGTANLSGTTGYYDLPINDGDNYPNYFDDLTLWNTPGEVDYNANH